MRAYTETELRHVQNVPIVYAQIHVIFYVLLPTQIFSPRSFHAVDIADFALTAKCNETNNKNFVSKRNLLKSIRV